MWETFFKEDGTTKFMWQKSFDARKYIEKDGVIKMQYTVNNFGVNQIVRNVWQHFPKKVKI